jgi:hypothetical protein
MKEVLKGNYKLPERNSVVPPEKKPENPLEREFEAAAFERLGGSITFVKKSASFIWKGKRDV